MTRPHETTGTRMTEAAFRALYEQLRGAVPWGRDDRRGALNWLTPELVLAACGEVTLGRTVSLAAPVGNRRAADNPEPARHQMTAIGADAGAGVAFSMDRIATNIHGNADSHLDALCHVIFDGELYNRVAAETVTEDGAAELSVATAAAGGIVGRGVLLDVPRARGISWLEPGDSVTVADVLAAEREQELRIGQGDIVLIRVGHRRRRNEQGPWDVAQTRAGLHPTVLPLLADRRAAALGSDSNNDTAPSLVANIEFPVHVLAVNALGLHLLDYLEFSALSEACAAAGRWSFLCVIAPLRLPTGTGSLVNPIAIL